MMTSFDPTKNYKPADEWSKQALQSTQENTLQWQIIGGIVLGWIAAGAAGPLTGALIAAYAIWDSWQKAFGIQRNQKAIIESSCIAQVLEGDDFINYAAQFGKDAVMAQLNYASERNLPMSDIAMDYFEDNQQRALGGTTFTQPALLPSNDSVISQGAGSEAVHFGVPETINDSSKKEESASKQPNRESLLNLPLPKRAAALSGYLVQSGFRIDDVMNGQVIAIAGTQRGGKGTLAGIITILSKAIDPTLNVEYFTAGVDIYPFTCNLHCALQYPSSNSDESDLKVASELLAFLKELENSEPYSHKQLILVIDEAMRLFGMLEEKDRSWAIQYLLSRFAKTGGTLVLVLHSNNLGAVVGTKNTGSLSSTFKQSTSFIGCVAKSVSAGGLRKINVASGAYFKANPNNFGTAIANGELGSIPNWMLTEKHPGNGYPDPVRTLLTFFPELYQEPPAQSKNEDKLSQTIQKLESDFRIEIEEPAPTESGTNFVLGLLEKTTASNWEQFILEDMKLQSDMVEATLDAIAITLEEYNRIDLAKKFPSKNPSKDLEIWIKSLKKMPTDEQIRRRCLLLGKEITKDGIEMIRKKFNL